jgi:hypothetical protein
MSTRQKLDWIDAIEPDLSVSSLAFWLAQHADLDFDHVEPTGVLGREVELQAAHDAWASGAGKVS